MPRKFPRWVHKGQLVRVRDGGTYSLGRISKVRTNFGEIDIEGTRTAQITDCSPATDEDRRTWRRTPKTQSAPTVTP